MRKPPKSMMGIASPTASHLPILEAAARSAGSGLVIEHGAGLYSTPLLARLGCNVLCCEPHAGWAEWARWIYDGRIDVVESFKRALERLGEAAVIFLDGPANERGVLLQASLDRGVPTIIVHDTQMREWSHYDFQPHHFAHPSYAVTHSSEDTHRTTLWQLKSS